ncbi:MAG: hypothetical protein ACTJFR_02700 [Canibacter sp.]
MALSGSPTDNNLADRNDYNIADSETVQENFAQAKKALEDALDRRDGDVKNAMADYYADGVSDEYAASEQDWNVAGKAVRDVINKIEMSLSENDDIARTAMTRARASIA